MEPPPAGCAQAASRLPAPTPRCFALADLLPAPWKNGGGSTREIAVWPTDASLDDFDWRVSVADIAADGPFSRFPGIDRQIALLDGAGVHLRAVDGSVDHALTEIGAPFAFAGDAAVEARLLGGPTRDLNVMTRRGRWRADLTVIESDRTQRPQEAIVLLLGLAGQWQVDASPLRSGRLAPATGLLLPPQATWSLKRCGEPARCLMVRLQPLFGTAAPARPDRDNNQ